MFEKKPPAVILRRCKNENVTRYCAFPTKIPHDEDLTTKMKKKYSKEKEEKQKNKEEENKTKKNEWSN